MADTGAQRPTVAENDSAAGSVSWQNAKSAIRETAYPSTAATCALNLHNLTTYFLNFKNFSLLIPEDATIDGISVAISRVTNYNTGTDYVRDNTVQLIVGGTRSGTNKADTGTNWPTSTGTANYGGVSDTWGLSLDPEDIMDPDFGLSVAITGTGSASLLGGYIFGVTLTVTYTSASGTLYSVASAIVGTGANGVGGADTWTSPGNITANDGVRASNGTDDDYTYSIRGTNLGFAIPSTATILGVRVSVEMYGTYTTSRDVKEYLTQLMVAGTPSGDNRADAAATSIIHSTEMVHRWGGYFDMWGLALTPAIVNASNFGVEFQLNHGRTRDSYIDYMQVEVVYVEAGSQDVEPTGVASAEALGSPEVSLRSLGMSGVESAEAFGTPTVAPVQFVEPDALDSTAALGSPEIYQFFALLPDSIDTGAAFGDLTIDKEFEDTGWVSFQAAVEVARSGSGLSWTDESQALVDDINPAYFPSTGTDEYSDYLVVSNPDWSIPTSVNIEGLLFRMRIIGDVSSHRKVFDSVISVVDDTGTIVGDNKSLIDGWLDGAGETREYGALDDNWGVSLTREMLLDVDFGIAISAYADNGQGGEIYYVEAMATYNPVFAQDIDLDGEGVNSTVAFGTPVFTSDQEVSPDGIASTLVFGTIAVGPEQFVSSIGGISSEESVSSFTALPVNAIDSVPSGETFGDFEIATYNAPGDNTGRPIKLSSFSLEVAYAPFDAIAPPSIASKESFGTPVINGLITSVLPDSIESEEVVSGNSILQSIARCRPDSIPETYAVSWPVVVTDRDVTLAGIESAEAFGDPDINLLSYINFDGGGIASSNAFGTLRMRPAQYFISIPSIEETYSISEPRISTPIRMFGVSAPVNAFGSFSVVEFGLFPDGIVSEESVSEPSVQLSISPDGVASGEDVSEPTVRRGIRIGYGVTTQETFGTFQVLNHPKIYPDGIPSGETFPAYSVVTGFINFDGEGIESAEAVSNVVTEYLIKFESFTGWASATQVGNITVARPPINFDGEGIESEESVSDITLGQVIYQIGIPTGFLSAGFTVGLEEEEISPEGIASGESVSEPEITTGSSIIYAYGVSSQVEFGEPELTQTVTPIQPISIGASDWVPNVRVGLSLTVSSIESSENVPDITVTPGASPITPTGVESGAIVSNVAIYADYDITPSSIESAEAFGSPTVRNAIRFEGIESAEDVSDVTVSPTNVIRMYSFTGSGLSCSADETGIPEVQVL